MSTNSSSDPMLAVLFLAISAGLGYVMYLKSQGKDQPRLSGYDYKWGDAPVFKEAQPPRAAERAKAIAREYGPKAYSAAKKGAGVAAKHVGKASKAAYGYTRAKAPVAARAAYGFSKDVYGGVKEGYRDFDPSPLIEKARAKYSKGRSKKTVIGTPMPEAFQLPRRTALGSAKTEFAYEPVMRGEAYTVPGKRGAVQRRGVAKTLAGDEHDPRLLAAIEAGGYEENRGKKRKKSRRRR